MHYFDLVQVDHTHNHNIQEMRFIQILISIMSEEYWVKKKFSSVGPKTWSKIPGDIKLCDIHKFKKEYKKFLEFLISFGDRFSRKFLVNQ